MLHHLCRNAKITKTDLKHTSRQRQTTKKQGGASRDSLARFKPADNLYDAIRFDVEPLGGVEFEPLLRQRVRELPDFSDPEYGTYDDE